MGSNPTYIRATSLVVNHFHNSSRNSYVTLPDSVSVDRNRITRVTEMKSGVNVQKIKYKPGFERQNGILKYAASRATEALARTR
jgi:hypothetical protein